MNISKATTKYEDWLSRRLTIIEDDLKLKHQQMRTAVFPFLRATYYRWAQIWSEVCEDAAKAPRVLSVGDLHVENFGTWRDADGRLIWGINDFDETWSLPYTNDLIRLATSAMLAEIGCDVKTGITAVLNGYREGLEAGGRPFALAEHHAALRVMATERLKEPERFWEKMHSLPPVEEQVPAGALKAIARWMPGRGLRWTIAHRVAGLGSLGRQRFVAIADWHGGSIAREAKALAPSACLWAQQGKGTAPIHYQEILDCSVRCLDPFVHVRQKWIVRRLAPDCSRIELAQLPQQRDEIRLLHAMGFETANVHLGTGKAKVLLADLKKRPQGWLVSAARHMEKAVRADFGDYN